MKEEMKEFSMNASKQDTKNEILTKTFQSGEIFFELFICGSYFPLP